MSERKRFKLSHDWRARKSRQPNMVTRSPDAQSRYDDGAVTKRARRVLMSGLRAAVTLALLSGGVASAQSTGPAPASVAPVTPARTIRVQVLGSVSHPGTIEVSEGDRLLQALTRAGIAAPACPDLRRVVLIRMNPETGKTAPAYMIDVSQANL